MRLRAIAGLAACLALVFACGKADRKREQSAGASEATRAAVQVSDAAIAGPERASSPDYPDPAGPLGACRPEEARARTGCPFPRTEREPQGPMPDFSIYFEPGRSFASGDDRWPTECVEVGALTLPGGRIVAGDAGMLGEAKPFARTVPRGRHPVVLLRARIAADHSRIAAAMVRFSSARPTSWVLATAARERPSAADPWTGYGVDTGTGGFASPEAVAALARVEAELEKAGADPGAYLFGDDYDGWSLWSNRCVDRARDLNLVAIRSGWGDGVYASFWGIDAKGKLAALVSWFDVLDIPGDPRP